MAALTRERDTLSRDAVLFEFPIIADTVLYAGGLGAMYAGGEVGPPGEGSPEAKVIGRVEETADNRGGLGGALRAKLRRGCFCYANSSGIDQSGLADVGGPCYAVDDQTVAKTSNSGDRPIAGVVRDVGGRGVWVDFGVDAIIS